MKLLTLAAQGDALHGKVDKYERRRLCNCAGKRFLPRLLGFPCPCPNYGNVVVVDGNGAVKASSLEQLDPSKAISVGSEATGPVMVFIG